ncbi:hypothetical protein GCM10027084_18690 [Pseudoxanthomonas sangjuensis]|uniref:hypothetical protein n=1 Tax=Pseudoxanthomonas sangjuensis TaxID=1503750 RepID=UPI001479474A|nr:hypothetical protein [Pseudoxanthomonas sangjuensis]
MRRMLALLLVLALAACAAPEAAPPAGTAAAPAEMTPLPAPPPQADAPARVRSGKVELDLTCRTDADCAVKDVGNCCGYYPMCVNKDSPTDPAGVQAECRASGRVGVCGFRNIDSCKCVANRCESAGVVMENAVPVR